MSEFPTDRIVSLSREMITAFTQLNELDLSTLAGHDETRTTTPGTLENNLLLAQQLAHSVLSLSTSSEHTELQKQYQDLHAGFLASESAIAALHTTNGRNEATIDHLLHSALGGGGDRSQKIPDPDKFDGTRSKYRQFVSKLRLKLMGDEHGFLTATHRLRYAFNLLEGAVYDQVHAYIVNTNGQDVFALSDVGTQAR